MTVTILRNASVLDPESATRAEGQAAAVENGRITDVGPGLSGPAPATGGPPAASSTTSCENSSSGRRSSRPPT